MKFSFQKEEFKKNFVVFNNLKIIVSYQFIIENLNKIYARSPN